MPKHRAEKTNLVTAIKREVWWFRNQWYCFVKPSLTRLLAGDNEPWRKYWRSQQ